MLQNGATENPNPPPRKDKSDDSSRGGSRHSSGLNGAGDVENSNTLQTQINASSAMNPSGGSSAHTYANPLRFLYLWIRW